MDGYVSLVMLYDALGEDRLVEETLAKLEDLCQRFDASEFDDIVFEMFNAKIHLQRGDLTAARQWVMDRGLTEIPSQKQDERSLAYRIYKYELSVLARWQIAEARYQDALDTLQELSDMATQARRPYLLVEASLLRAQIYHLQGERELSLEAMRNALVIAAPVGMCRIFLTEGDDVIQLLRVVRSVGNAPDLDQFIEHVLAKIESPAGKMTSPSLDTGESLSSRELEVLRLLPTGLTAVELANELFISVNTLRSHLKNIYAKLGVHSRHEAVVKAAQLDLLQVE
jgi:LuxR family maltose regulon positive regulatory protein